jgi:hypothetical protein
MTNNIGEGLYLLRLREFENNKENIYKIGRANNLCNRMKQYPNGSVIYLMIECTDSKKHENKLINLFISKYTHNSMCGREYFNGNLDNMINDIINYIQKEMTETFCKMIKKNIIIDKINKNMNTKKSFLQNELENKSNIIILKKNNSILKNNVKKNDNNNNDKINNDNNNNIKNNGNDIDNNNNNNNKNDRVCVCNKHFQYPYLLKKHLNNKPKCFEKYYINTSKTNIDSICKYCNKLLSNKFSCERHEKICKLRNIINTQEVNNLIVSNNSNVIIDLLNYLSNDEKIKQIVSKLKQKN